MKQKLITSTNISYTLVQNTYNNYDKNAIQ